MASPDGPLPHLWVRGRAENRTLRRRGRDDPKIRDVERRTHGTGRRDELTSSLTDLDQRRAQAEPSLEELRALGVILVLEGAEAVFHLRLDSLERMSTHRVQRPMWLLLNVAPAAAGIPERATVWVSDEYRAKFLALFENYLARETKAGQPLNRGLVANIGRIRAAVLSDLWQSGGPPTTGVAVWWELWLRPSDDGVNALHAYATATGLRVSDRVLHLNDRTVMWIEARWEALQALPFTAVPLAEIRRPELVDTIEDLPREDQDELAEDLKSRVTPADRAAPTIVHLDTGVMQSHALLVGSLAADDVHSIVGLRA